MQEPDDNHLADLSSRCSDILAWSRTGILPEGALREFAAAIPADRVTHLTAEMTADQITRIEAVTLVADMAQMHPLLPPASIDGDYLAGWCEGQSYLMMNYGTDEAEDAMLRTTNLLNTMQGRIAVLEKALKHARKHAGTVVTDTAYIDRILAGESE